METYIEILLEDFTAFRYRFIEECLAVEEQTIEQEDTHGGLGGA